MGIEVIWNPPRSPRKNAKVERSQGTLGRWTEYENCPNSYELQKRLSEQANFYNYHFPIRRKKYKTRIQLFPKLAHNPRKWNPKDFKLTRVLDFLKNARWQRKIASSGTISIYGKVYSVGKKYQRQVASLKLNAVTNQWLVYSENGQLIAHLPTLFTKKNICELDLS
jgi:hypothetical protein